MSSTYTVSPSALHDNSSSSRMNQPRAGARPYETQHHVQPDNAADSNHLSPFSPSQAHSNSASASPTLNNSNTPAESISTLSVQYQSSDFSEVDDDPFFGVDFSGLDPATPAFLDDQLFSVSEYGGAGVPQVASGASYDAQDPRPYHPLSPDQTPSLPTASPPDQRPGPGASVSDTVADSISPQVLSKHTKSLTTFQTHAPSHPQLTPENTGSNRSSEDGLAPAEMTMPCHSPRVTVSLWSRENAAPGLAVESAFEPETISPATVRGGVSTDDNFVPYARSDSFGVLNVRDGQDNWLPNNTASRRGLDPDNRPSAEVPSANELAADRKREERNQEVDDWLSRSDTIPLDPNSPPPGGEASGLQDSHGDDGIPRREIPLGDETENVPVPGQTYYLEEGGPITQEDLDIMRQSRNWANAPVLFSISKDSYQYQPQTSDEAMRRFERMCKDNESIVSRAATWGTRRRSLPSISDIEGVTSGNFLKKLSISRGDIRRPSILKELRGLVRKPSASQILKRARTGQDEENGHSPDTNGDRRESRDSLAPPSRSLSWGKKSMPSINTALVSMGSNAASIGTTHARSASITTPVTSPKSPFTGLSVKNTLRRPRSKSDLPKNANSGASHPNLVDMWKKSGGPPVASLAKPSAYVDPDDDDDDDEDMYEDADMKTEITKVIDGITPNFAGFQQLVLRLNPALATSNNYLVDRIAHQQIIRYKTLLTARVKHLQQISSRSCPCGSMCIAQGGSATILDTKGDPRGIDPLSARFEGSDGDITPLEGAISQESFPQDIPMPPTSLLPAEFECQLCYQSKKFQKPSDWTKHVHEDVQPFTCTWDRCRDPKIFKRKADWVRHENEGHRHLEWWTCDVDDCRHTCYRRDNFLQHLVREHKFPEPKAKTKAAIKRTQGVDPTWQKVEKCHVETHVQPKEEPCRFCGKSFPSWKKLTVHLAKHMEQISLPILRLVARKELDADSIISPVQEPPPRNFAAFPIKSETSSFTATPNVSQPSPINPPPDGLVYPNPQQNAFMYPMVPQPGPFQHPFYSSQFNSIPPNLDATHIDLPQVSHPYANPNMHAYQNMPVTTSPYMAGPSHQFVSGAPNVEPFRPAPMNALGLQDPATQFSFDGIMDPAAPPAVDQYTPQGSVSPFSHSPHQGAAGFYSQ